MNIKEKSKKMYGWHAKKYTNKVGMIHGSKVNDLAKPHLYIFSLVTQQAKQRLILRVTVLI